MIAQFGSAIAEYGCHGDFSTCSLLAGLFHSVIAQSGSAIAEYGCHGDDDVNFQWYIHEVGKLFACDNSSMEMLVECIRQHDWKDFIQRRVDVRLYRKLNAQLTMIPDSNLYQPPSMKLIVQNVICRL